MGVEGKSITNDARYYGFLHSVEMSELIMPTGVTTFFLKNGIHNLQKLSMELNCDSSEIEIPLPYLFWVQTGVRVFKDGYNSQDSCNAKSATYSEAALDYLSCFDSFLTQRFEP